MHGDGLTPGFGLGIEVIEILPLPGWPEVVPDVADAPFYPPLLTCRDALMPQAQDAQERPVTSTDRHRSGFITVVGGKL